jgi:hypothetical protein
MVRRAHNHDTRDWVGDNAPPEADEVREWVVWGAGLADPSRVPPGAPADDIALDIARAEDPYWSSMSQTWCVVVRADENDIDAFVEEESSARGYAAFLMEGRNDEMPRGYMRGRLRSDVGPRRKVDQPRPN